MKHFSLLQYVWALVLVAAAAAAAMLLSPAVWGVVHHRHKVSVVVQAWREAGPHTSLLGQVRARLCTAWWLGPLRPSCPKDPLVRCGVTEEVGWRGTLALVMGVKSPLSCLEEQQHHAWQEHYAFVLVFLVGVCCVVVVPVWAEFTLARGAPRCQDTFENAMAHLIKLKMETLQGKDVACTDAILDKVFTDMVKH